MIEILHTQFIRETLALDPNLIGYHVDQQLAAQFPDKGVVLTTDNDFYLEDYAKAGQCSVSLNPAMHNVIFTGWNDSEAKITQHFDTGWRDVVWQGHTLAVFRLTWGDGSCEQRSYWIVADTQEIAASFFGAVCKWNSEIRGEVLVFEDGYWRKSEELFQAIKNATFDNLILQGTLKEEVFGDLVQFFASRETYRRYGIPWKRGVIFIGPPGNGKTHEGVDQSAGSALPVCEELQDVSWHRPPLHWGGV